MDPEHGSGTWIRNMKFPPKFMIRNMNRNMDPEHGISSKIHGVQKEPQMFILIAKFVIFEALVRPLVSGENRGDRGDRGDLGRGSGIWDLGSGSWNMGSLGSGIWAVWGLALGSCTEELNDLWLNARFLREHGITVYG